MRARHLRHLITLAAAAILAACGGGGGGSSPTTRAPLPQVVSDTNPVGDRVDLRSRNYFPAAAGDSWTYVVSNDGISTGQTVTRTVTSASADTISPASIEYSAARPKCRAWSPVNCPAIN